MKRLLAAVFLLASIFLWACDRGPGENREVEALIKKRCTICHTTERIYKARQGRAWWEQTIDRMIRHGAELTPDERKEIIDFLSQRK